VNLPADPVRPPADPPSAEVPAATPSPPPPVIEARQRWRLVLRRTAGGPALGQREVAAAFDAGLVTSGLPLVPSGRMRSRIILGAPLPVGVAARRELADLFIAERVPVHDLRERLGPCLPDGWDLVEAYDVWLGEPALVAQVVGAEYRVTLADAVPPDALARATTELLQAPALPRERAKGAGSVAYDLRPLVLGLSALATGTAPELLVTVRIHPELGSGRPEEVVAALADGLGQSLGIVELVRERVLMAVDLEEASDRERPTGPSGGSTV
jgi:radical SAM-linked protein